MCAKPNFSTIDFKYNRMNTPYFIFQSIELLKFKTVHSLKLSTAKTRTTSSRALRAYPLEPLHEPNIRGKDASPTTSPAVVLIRVLITMGCG